MLQRFFTVLVYIFAAIGFLLVAGYFAVSLGLTNEQGIIDTQRESFLGATPYGRELSGLWHESEEWKVLEEAIRRDEEVLKRAARDAGVSPRVIAASLVAEQLRLFFTEREAYKKFFYPLKILGPQSQFSWGVMGMKEETAIAVEQHLVDSSSPFYLGPAFEDALAFPATTTDIQTARFTRMTDQYDHYYSYLYAGLYINQLSTQWRKAGHPVDSDIAILSTLYNIGFERSQPKANPQVGGSAVTLGTKTYSFGGLASEFYHSSLLTDTLPR